MDIAQDQQDQAVCEILEQYSQQEKNTELTEVSYCHLLIVQSCEENVEAIKL